MCVQLPLDAEPADIENFEFSTLRLRPPLCQSGSVIWNTQASDGFEITGLSPSHQERVRLFFLSMRYDAGNLSAESLERVRFSVEHLLWRVTLCFKVKQLARKDAMYPLTPSDLNSIWRARLHLKNIEEALPKVCRASQPPPYPLTRWQVILAMPRNDLDAQVISLRLDAHTKPNATPLTIDQMSLQYLLQVQPVLIEHPTPIPLFFLILTYISSLIRTHCSDLDARRPRVSPRLA